VTAPVSGFLAQPARVALAGDWHANTAYAVEAIRHARRRDSDVVIQLGDFGFHFLDSYLDALDSTLADEDLILGFVDGNHEDFDRLLAVPVAADGLRYLRERIVHIPRGFRWDWAGVECLAVGGAYSIDRFLRTPGQTWWPQETLTAEQVGIISASGHADAMFCHDCPSGVENREMARRGYGYPAEALAESDRNRVRLRHIVDAVRPHRLWHGHFHLRYQSVLAGGDYRTVVDGLGRDGEPIDNNLVVVNVADIARNRATSQPAASGSMGSGAVPPSVDAPV